MRTRWLTLDVAASLIGLTNRELGSLVRRRQVPFVPIPGNHVIFDRQDLAEWLNGLKSGARPEEDHALA
jgi:excisionase family DNA binding protein